MRPPAFWYRPKGWQARLLTPLGALYATATARRLSHGASTKLDIPVICVGNINAGGTGKTPTTIALAERLKALGKEPHIISRGYGGRLEGPVRVLEGQHRASDVGDEPLLLSAFAPVWVAKNRALGGPKAVEAGADVILLDDGHQNPALHKDISIVIADAALGFGNKCTLPAGPLREPVDVGLSRADVLLTIGTHKAQARFDGLNSIPEKLSHLRGQLQPLQTGMDWEGLRVFAFAGIGMPEKFFATLRSLGAELVGHEALDDHQPFSDALLTRLANQAAGLGGQLVTTEKDAVRLPASFRSQVLTVPVRLEIQDWSALDALLDRI